MIAYIIKSSLSLLIWFGLYWFLLRKEKFLIFNRFYLVLSIVFSLIIPIITIPVNVQAAQNLDNIFSTINNLNVQKTNLSSVTINPELSQSFNNLKSHPRINISEILIILYFTGLAVYLFRFLKNIYIILRQAGVSDKVSYCGYVIVLIDYKTNPYSFLNYIFISRYDYNNKTIAKIFLDHELEHIRQSHSIDIVFIEFIKILYWFNPILFLYNKAIRLNHEYLADDGVIHNELDLRTYIDSLLNFTLNNRTIPLASGLNHSHIKKRIKMITKSKSGHFQSGFKIATLTVTMITSLFLVSAGCSQKPSANQGKEIVEPDTNQIRNMMIAAEYLTDAYRESKLQNYEGVIAAYTKVIELQPYYARNFYILRGEARHALKDYSGAIGDFTKAIDNSYRDGVVYGKIGMSMYAKQDYIGAINDLTKAIKLDPNNMWNFYYRGLAKIESGDKNDGCLDLKKAAAFNSPDAKEAVKKYCL